MIQQVTVNDYLDYINKSYPRAKFPLIGNIYVFSYLFTQSKSYDISKSKFYDFFPCVFVYDINIKKHLFHGFNLNTIPPSARNTWIELLKKYTEGNKLDPKKFVVLKRLFAQSTFAMRQYEMRNIKKLWEVPKNNWIDIEVYANTTFKATMGEISAKYLSLI